MISDKLAMAVYPSTNDRKFAEVKKYGDGFEDKIIISFELFNKKGEHIGWSSSGGGISKVANDCKEWINSNGYDIIHCTLSDGRSWVQICEYDNTKLKNKLSPYIHADNNNNAIFKASEYLLVNFK